MARNSRKPSLVRRHCQLHKGGLFPGVSKLIRNKLKIRVKNGEKNWIPGLAAVGTDMDRYIMPRMQSFECMKSHIHKSGQKFVTGSFADDDELDILFGAGKIAKHYSKIFRVKVVRARFRWSRSTTKFKWYVTIEKQRKNVWGEWVTYTYCDET